MLVSELAFRGSGSGKYAHVPVCAHGRIRGAPGDSERTFFGPDNVSDLLIPGATDTDPEVARVGLYEKDLDMCEIPCTSITREFDDVDRGIVGGVAEDVVKIHVKKGTDRILGATSVGALEIDMKKV